jgi:hypothetical protein
MVGTVPTSANPPTLPLPTSAYGVAGWRARAANQAFATSPGTEARRPKTTRH